MISNLEKVEHWNRRGVSVIFCNVWCRRPQGAEPQWVGDACTTRAQSCMAAINGARAAYFVGYRLRIRIKPGAFK